MQFPLYKFEDYIDDKILKRGLAYFKRGVILDFSEIYNGNYEAIVSGTEQYTVHLEVKNNTITTYNCDCPYDYGPVCKHIIAAIFYLQEDIPAISIPNPKKSKSISQQVKDLLQVIPHTELKDFIQENSEKDRQFRNHFLAYFGHLNQKQSKAFYQKQIHSILKTAAGRDGWIGWQDMKYVVSSMQVFLDNSENFVSNRNFKSVFYCNTALLEEMTEALQYGDDSNGEFGYFIDAALGFLYKLTQEKLPDKLRKELFEYCITSFNQKLFEGWDWHLGMLHLACEMIDKEKDADSIIACLDTISEGYIINQAQALKLDLLRMFKAKNEVDTFIHKHISNNAIRKKEIEKAFEEKNFERVITLSKDGIEWDKKDKPGLVKAWYNWLLKVAQVQRDTEKIIEYARFLFIDNFYPEQDYYQVLKDTVDRESWHEFLENIIKEITPTQSWTKIELIRKIYIKEKWWDKLFLMLKQNPTLENIKQNESYLSKTYATQLIDLYDKAILKYLDEQMGRTSYRQACRYLRRMKKLGGTEQVNELIDIIKSKYPRRIALMDELNKV